MTSKFHAFSLGCVAAALAWPAQAAFLDFEAIGLAAPSTGTAVLNSFSSDGLIFSANAYAFHNSKASGNDDQGQIPKPPDGFGYVRGQLNGFGDFTSFTIFIVGKNYVNFSLNIGAPTQPSQILAYDAGNVLLNTSLSSFANTNGWAWTGTPFELVNRTNQTAIDHILFMSGKSGFAIDDLLFTEAGGGGGKVPEPAGLGLVGLALAAAGAASRRVKPA